MALKLTLVTALSPILCQSSRFAEFKHGSRGYSVVPDANFDDWVVRAHIGQEFAHYPTREAAERVAQAIAQERETGRRPVTPSCRRHARGSMPAVEAGA